MIEHVLNPTNTAEFRWGKPQGYKEKTTKNLLIEGRDMENTHELCKKLSHLYLHNDDKKLEQLNNSTIIRIRK